MFFGCGGWEQNHHSCLTLQLSLPEIPWPEAASAHLCLQLGPSYCENRHWHWILGGKVPWCEEGWAGFPFVMGTLSYPHLEGRFGRGWEAPRAGHTVSWSRLSPGAEAGPRLGGWPLGHAATGLLPGLFLTKAECWFSGAPISASPCGFVSVPEHSVQLPCPLWLLALALLASHTCARL